MSSCRQVRYTRISNDLSLSLAFSRIHFAEPFSIWKCSPITILRILASLRLACILTNCLNLTLFQHFICMRFGAIRVHFQSIMLLPDPTGSTRILGKLSRTNVTHIRLHTQWRKLAFARIKLAIITWSYHNVNGNELKLTLFVIVGENDYCVKSTTKQNNTPQSHHIFNESEN